MITLRDTGALVFLTALVYAGDDSERGGFNIQCAIDFDSDQG
jgi:hypothetical protein